MFKGGGGGEKRGGGEKGGNWNTASTSWNAKIDWKALSKRIGHADVAFTMKQYVQTDLEADRQVANTLAELIIGGALASFEISRRRAARHQARAAEKPREQRPVHKSVHK